MSTIHEPEIGVIDAAYLANHRAWSKRTFGPGPRLLGVLDHIRKELTEIEDDPTNVEEWVDVVILAFDGALRAGCEPKQIIDAMQAKQAKNMARTWPDWRGIPADQAIEHTSCDLHVWGSDDFCATCGDPRATSPSEIQITHSEHGEPITRASLGGRRHFDESGPSDELDPNGDLGRSSKIEGSDNE